MFGQGVTRLALTLVQIAAGIVLALIPTLRWALSAPQSTPRELTGYVVLALVGAIALISEMVNPLSGSLADIAAYLGAGALGTMLIDAGSRAASMLEGGSAPARR